MLWRLGHTSKLFANSLTFLWWPQMPFKPAVANISPLAWCLGISAVANVVTMAAVLYLAFGTPKVYVKDGFITSSIDHVDDRAPVRVQVIPR